MAIKTITIKGEPIRYEAVVTSGQTVTPGMLVKLQSNGTIRSHASAGQVLENAFALEDDLQGKDIATAYAAASICQFGIFRPGDVVNAILATSQTIVKGDFLESAGNGNLRKYAADSAGVVEYPLSVVAVALENVTTTSATARIQARII